ncbi:uncharacterized protein LOC124942395 [Impatiens glandulifera]|uniref:uncharacterized protein LOC124942395 n=1 Tax=Impatiens glandulifera TaxID=253017 RepID=UPI001FB0CEEF|nr:uncharacterized protein LOC124942395 [Impatiens glandulifera]
MISANKKDSKLNNRGADKKKLGENSEITSKSISVSGGDNRGNIGKVKDVDHSNDDIMNTNEKKKKKKKRKEANDLRFEKADELGVVVGARKLERKRKHREEMKNKKINKKAKLEDGNEFAGHEDIKFGEVVKAPPKILTVPKASRASINASKERLRLKAIEEYRNRKGWASRPGTTIPVIPDASITTTST